MKVFRMNDSVQFFIDELRARVVADSGIPSDRFHLGKLVFRRLKDDPDFIAQIDGATGEKDTNESLLKRSIQCANYFKSLGLKRGDVIFVMAPNHLDLAVVYYAVLFFGYIICPMHENEHDLQNHFEQLSPKIIICQSAKTSDVSTALKKTGIEATVLTFDRGSHYDVLSDMLIKHENYTTVNEFKVEDFDPDETLVLLGTSSGTTGSPKYISSSHKNFSASGHYWWSHFKEFPLPNPMQLMLSPSRWITGSYFIMLSPIMKITRLQTSQVYNVQHVYHLINTYKPSHLFLSSPLMMQLVNPGHEQCDFSSFESLGFAGNVITLRKMKQLQEKAPNALIGNCFGMTETNGFICLPNESPLTSCGVPLGHMDVRLIDLETQEDITEPNKQGQLIVKSPAIFKGYYKNPQATKAAFTEDGWLKTGDVLYRDEQWNFYYVERINLYLKYNEQKVSPVQTEQFICQHPGVIDAAVIGIPEPSCGDLIVACVVREPGSSVTAQEIKDMVKDKLPDSNQLRGGVVFLDHLPMTTSSKLDRRKIREMALQLLKQ